MRTSSPSGAMRRRSRRMWTSSALRVGAPPGQARRASRSRPTTAPKRRAWPARAPARPATARPSGHEVEEAVVVDLGDGAGTGGPPGQRGSRAWTSASPAGRRTQSSSGSTVAGGASSLPTSRQAGRTGRPQRRRAATSSSGQRNMTTRRSCVTGFAVTSLAASSSARVSLTDRGRYGHRVSPLLHRGERSTSVRRHGSYCCRVNRTVERSRPGRIHRMAKTLSEKVWDRHVVRSADGEPDLLYIDLHLVHEVTSPQAFDGLRLERPHGAPPRPHRRHDGPQRPHHRHRPAGRPTRSRRKQMEVLARNCAEFGIRLYAMGDAGQGIVHVIGPEQGLTQPGMTIVCGDSHTSTHGAFGALAFGIGTSEVEHVLATQTLPQAAPGHDGGHRRRRAARGRHRQGRRARRSSPASAPAAGSARSSSTAAPAIRGALDGGPHDGLQHVDRSRRARRHGRARRHDVRLPRGPPVRADRRGVGARARRVAGAPHRRRRRRSTRKSRSTPRTLRPAVTLGHEPRADGHHRRRRPRPRARSPTPTERDAAMHALALHGAEGGDTDPRHRRRHRVHRLVHELAHRGPARCRGGRARAGTCATACARSSCPARCAVKAEAGGRGARRGVHRRRLRVARAGLLDVPGDEPRQARARRAVRVARRTATSRAARARAGAPTSCPPPSRPRPRSPATSPHRPIWTEGPGDQVKQVSARSSPGPSRSTAPTSTPTRSSRATG